MRIYTVFLVLAMVGCGSEGGEDSGQDEKPAEENAAIISTEENLEVVRINPAVSCVDDCSAEITLLLTGGRMFTFSGYLPVVTVTENAAAETCDSKSLINEYGESVAVPDLKFSTTYFIRACLFKKSDSTYTPGMVADFTTKPKP